MPPILADLARAMFRSEWPKNDWDKTRWVHRRYLDLAEAAEAEIMRQSADIDKILAERPGFEITDLKGRHIKIWADGRTEGLEDMEPRIIINRLTILGEA